MAKLSAVNPSELAKFSSVREVRHVPALNNGRAKTDGDYITTAPALIPDILAPIDYAGCIVAVPYNVTSVWVDIDIPEDYNGVLESELTVKLVYVPRGSNTDTFETSENLTVEIINASLPKQKLLFTQWFHSDCIADYYKVEKWSDEHFELISK